MVQNPVQQAAQQPQAGDIWSDIQTFSRTPQGQQALLAFANSAMQSSMNPRTGGGAGLIGAVGAGMQGYKAADEYQSEKAWQTESRAAQRKEWKQKEVTDPLEIRKLTAQIAQLEAPPEGSLKPGQTVEIPGNTKDGRGITVKKMFLGGDIRDVNNENVYRTLGVRVFNAPPPAPRAPHVLNPAITSWFQSPAGGSRKDIRTLEDLQKLTPEQSAAFYEVVKKTPAMQNALQLLLSGVQGEQQGAAPINVNPEELK
jgi:hypothetical protein